VRYRVTYAHALIMNIVRNFNLLDPFREWTANGWDADADWVKHYVYTTGRQQQVITVDNGTGIPEEEMTRRYLRTGSTHKAELSFSARHHRGLVGRLGFGKWSAFCLKPRYKLFTRCAGEPRVRAYDIAFSERRGPRVRAVDEYFEIPEHGTAIVLDNPTRAISLHELYASLQITFFPMLAFHPEFAIFLNGKSVEAPTWPAGKIYALDLTAKHGPITGQLIDPYDKRRPNYVYFYNRLVLVQKRMVDANPYLTGYVLEDWMDLQYDKNEYEDPRRSHANRDFFETLTKYLRDAVIPPQPRWSDAMPHVIRSSIRVFRRAWREVHAATRAPTPEVEEVVQKPVAELEPHEKAALARATRIVRRKYRGRLLRARGPSEEVVFKVGNDLFRWDHIPTEPSSFVAVPAIAPGQPNIIVINEASPYMEVIRKTAPEEFQRIYYARIFAEAKLVMSNYALKREFDVVESITNRVVTELKPRLVEAKPVVATTNETEG
jgi:hypothetical protein